MELHKPFGLAAVLGAETSAAEDENHGMRSLQFGELAAFRGVVGKLVVGKDGAWNNVSSHGNSLNVGCATPGYVSILVQGCRGEKSVRARNVESIFSTSLPLASDLSRTLCHSGSSRKACQLAVAASRFGCARMYTRVLPLRGSSVGVQYAMFLMPCFSKSFMVWSRKRRSKSSSLPSIT